MENEFANFNLIGRSKEFLKSLKFINKFAKYDVPVLIQGETGTGKELAARAIHYISNRQGHPFIPINCGAIPDNLIENEFFGHEKGAYTDAKQNQTGLISRAEGGTLFLDEVNTLSLKAQVSLLRFMQDHQFTPLGGQKIIKANVRIIAAANKPLSDLIQTEKFREDLYFRLNRVSLDLPPLRDRIDDIEILAKHFLRDCHATYKQPGKVLHPELVSWLKSQPWKGNVRELENFIHQQFLLSDDAVIRLTCAKNREHKTAWKNSISKTTFKELKAQVVADFEISYLSTLLNDTNGNVTLAAKRAGKERRALGKLLKKYGLDSADYRSSD